MTLLAGTVVVVSGVGPGLGRSIALQSARAGADLVLAARTASRLDEVAKEVTALGRRAVTIPTDITDEGPPGTWPRPRWPRSAGSTRWSTTRSRYRR